MKKPEYDPLCRCRVWYNELGKIHREGGPAIEYENGTKTWCLNGVLVYTRYPNGVFSSNSNGLGIVVEQLQNQIYDLTARIVELEMRQQ